MSSKRFLDLKKVLAFEKKITNLKNAHVLHGFEKMVTNLENNIHGFKKVHIFQGKFKNIHEFKGKMFTKKPQI